MLTRLKISNYILIDELELEFNNGLTVVTGETGSGKSIIIDALIIVFGARVAREIIRREQDNAYFEAEFTLTNSLARSWLIENELIDNDNPNNILVRRVIDINGKNKIYINGQSVTVGQVKILGDFILDIHTQNASITLLKTDIQRKLLDEFSANLELVSRVETLYSEINKLKASLNKAIIDANELDIKRQILEATVNELTELALKPNEWDELERQHKALLNGDKIIDSFNKVIIGLDDQDLGILKNLRRIKLELEQLSDKADDVAELMNYINNAEIELSELSYAINHAVSKIDTDPVALQNVEERINSIFDISRKYRITPEEIENKLAVLQSELINLNYSLDIESIKKQLEEKNKSYMQIAKELSQKRQVNANILSHKVTELLNELAISGQFVANLIPQAEIMSYGLEQIEYQISFNKGMSLQPLAKVASGGELSRTALALYLLLSIHNPPEVIIFDEIDVGIGGKVASSVGKMLYKLGCVKQVICITHQAQTAVFGDSHLVVSKEHYQDKTKTKIEYLTDVLRVDELSRMIGGVEITQITTDHAKDMLNQALQDKRGTK